MDKSLILMMIIISSTSGEQSLFDVHDYDMFGNRMAVYADQFVLIARNDLRQFFIGYDMFSVPLSISAHYCHLTYFDTHDYVQSVAVSSINSSFFVYTGETLNRTLHFIGIVHISKTCVSTYINRQYFTSHPSLEGYDVYTLDVDPRGLFAYLIGWDSSWIYDLTTFQLKQLDSFHDIWQQMFKPYNLIILDDNQHAIVVGYSFLIDWSFHMAISLLRLYPPKNITLVTNEILLPHTQPIEEDQLTYSPMNDLAVSINAQNEMLIGIPRYNLVLFGSVSMTPNVHFSVSETNLSWIAGGMFGKSVAWLDNGSFAVLAYSIAVPPWSSSQVLVFYTANNMSSTTQPKFTYPNNQQSLDSSLGSPKFPRLIPSGSGNLAILLNNGHVKLLCVAPAGMYTTRSQLVSNGTMTPFYGCELLSCLAGTFQPSSSIGPCYVCPSGKKNSKISNTTNIECEPCSSDGYCPLAAIDNVPRDPYTVRTSQALSYPENPESDAYDDILVQNMFRLPTNSSRCLLVSPLFWTLITVGIVFLVIALAGVFRILPKFMRHYLWITRIFKKTDLIGEGELWIGGLVSFSVLVLVIFTYAFSGIYIHQYPIEKSSANSMLCDGNMRNAKFSTGFRLLSLPVTDDEAPMFTLLNEQPFTLSIDLLNTMITCPDVTITIKSGAHEIPFHNYNCNRTSSIILSISLSLPTHLVTVDFNFSSSHSIGGLRVCVSGPERLERNIYTVRSLQICEFFGETNETLGHKPHVTLMFTKVINKTEPLVVGDPILYSGLFIPTVTAEGISDRFLYDLHGEYQRYLFTYTFLAIDLGETQFYVLNRQDPIVREGEMIFHNILFTIAVIELFGFTFLICKLAIIPFVRLLASRFFHQASIKPSVDEEEKNDSNLNTECIHMQVQARRHSAVP